MKINNSFIFQIIINSLDLPSINLHIFYLTKLLNNNNIKNYLLLNLKKKLIILKSPYMHKKLQEYFLTKYFSKKLFIILNNIKITKMLFLLLLNKPKYISFSIKIFKK
jgi:hypothetical protein